MTLRELLSPKTLEHNGIDERRNILIIEATRAMMFENNLAKIFQREVVNTIVYTMNRVKIRQGTGKTPYELQFGHASLVKYFKIFRSKCYLKRDDDIGKFDSRGVEGMFLDFSLKRKAYRCFSQRTKTIVEITNVRMDDKFTIQERILNYNFDQKTNPRTKRENIELFYETNTDLQNEVQNEIQVVELREEPRI